MEGEDKSARKSQEKAFEADAVEKKAQSALSGQLGESSSTPNLPSKNTAVRETTNSVSDVEKKKADWHIYVATVGVIASFILNSIALFITASYNQQNFDAVQKQVQLQRESVEQSRPVDFEAISEALSTGDLRLSIKNRGRAEIIQIKGQFRFYFALENGKIFSWVAVQNLLESNTNLLQLCQSKGILQNPEDVQWLLGATREFTLASLDPADKVGFEPEISQASLQNALRIAKCINARTIMSWQFEYEHQISLQKYTTCLYLLIETGASNDILQVRAQRLLDLNKTLGGKSLINAVSNYEESTTELITSKY